MRTDDRIVSDLGIETRKEILRFSLIIEAFASGLLATLLKINDSDTSLSFGNKSYSISFNQKINLLIDLEVINKESKKILTTFAEIRNQFMHNIYAMNYEKCFSYLEGKEKWLLSKYPDNEIGTKELMLKNATLNLAQDAVKIVSGMGISIEKLTHKK